MASSTSWRTKGKRPRSRLLSSYAYQQRRGLSNQFAIGEGLVGQCALEKTRILITDVPPHYVRIGSGLGNGRPRQHRRHPDHLRGRSQGHHRAGLVQPLHRHPPHVPRPAHRGHRHRAQHHLRRHADGAVAQAISVAGRRAAKSAGRAQGEERAAGAADDHPPRLRGPAQAATGSAPEEQRGAGGQGPAAGRPEDRGREEEPPDRAGPRGPAGDGPSNCR